MGRTFSVRNPNMTTRTNSRVTTEASGKQWVLPSVHWCLPTMTYLCLSTELADHHDTSSVENCGLANLNLDGYVAVFGFLFSVFCFLFLVPCSLFLVPCSLFRVLCSLYLFVLSLFFACMFVHCWYVCLFFLFFFFCSCALCLFILCCSFVCSL